MIEFHVMLNCKLVYTCVVYIVYIEILYTVKDILEERILIKNINELIDNNCLYYCCRLQMISTS